MMRLFNIREGFSEADDKLPARFFQPKTDGILSKTKLEPAKFEGKKILLFINGLGPSHTGIPLPEKIEELQVFR